MAALLATTSDGTSNGRAAANFTLTHHDPNTGREFTTAPVPIDASAAQVSDALSALINCGPVRVTRSDHSSNPNGTLARPLPYDGSGVGTAPLKIEWRVTFLGRRERRNLPLLRVERQGYPAKAPMRVFEIQAGRKGPGDRDQRAIVPALAAPTAVEVMDYSCFSLCSWTAPSSAGARRSRRRRRRWQRRWSGSPESAASGSGASTCGRRAPWTSGRRGPRTRATPTRPSTPGAPS